MSIPPVEDTLPSYPYELTKSHELAIDIDLSDGTGEQAWQRIRFIHSADPQRTPVTTDAPTYEDRGSPSAEVTGESWTLNFYVQNIVKTSDGAWLPEVAKLMELTQPDATGNAAVGAFRWYDWPDATRPVNADDAFSGIGTVTLARAATGADGSVAGWNVTITGKGRRSKIEHPNANAGS